MAICNELLKNNVPIIFGTLTQLVEKYAICYKNHTESELTKLYTKVDLLVIDDLGVEPMNDWLLSKLFVIINERIINELPFIITTNYDKVHEIFGNKLISLKAKSFFEEYYIKENNVYTYIFYMPFANFYLIDYLNYLTTNDLHSDIKVRVLCFDYSVEYIRKYLNEKIEVNCIYHKHR